MQHSGMLLSAYLPDFLSHYVQSTISFVNMIQKISLIQSLQVWIFQQTKEMSSRQEFLVRDLQTQQKEDEQINVVMLLHKKCGMTISGSGCVVDCKIPFE
ncbi:hypothetical protein PAXRUDRAFT_836523 [Paxillus rubicundulus Ve08.2h10]|uniref:Uncharacterized protein n=1 Tax=Paxillus rubicundulus Ve08.2h10 TaxID=930991 RepID=A0A0D0CNA4_9AGAM|nr:hypothetical protein PAXRUDRAFT_836523 [Paxillus rubicundulus Ve08.2h10]